MASSPGSKRSHRILQTNPVSYLERLLSEVSPEMRRLLSLELEKEILIQFRSLWQAVRNQEIPKTPDIADLSDRLVTTLEIVRSFGFEPEAEPDQAAADPLLLEEDYRSNRMEQQKIASFTKEVLYDLLVEEGYLTEENKDLFIDVIQGGYFYENIPIKVNWIGTTLSLVNFAVVGYYMKLFKIDMRIPKGGGPGARKPAFDAAIRKTFHIRGKPVYTGITKEHINPVMNQLPKFLALAREKLKKPERPATDYGDLEDCLALTDNEKMAAEFSKSKDIAKLDFDVLRVLSRLIDSGDYERN